MTNQKLYALRTIPLPGEKGEWVRYEDDSSIVLSEQEDNSDLESLLAIKNTGKPCEWVEVCVVEAKAVDETVCPSCESGNCSITYTPVNRCNDCGVEWQTE